MPYRYFLECTFCLFIGNLLFLSATVAAANAAWGDPVRDSEGIRVYTRSIEGSAFREYRAETAISASLDSILAVLKDIPACTQWLHQCKEGRLLEEVSFNQRYVYQASDMPFPVRDRDYVVLATSTMHADKRGVTLTLEAQPDYLPETRDLRIREINGFYDLTRTVDADGMEMVNLVWEQHVDPAGNIPGWLTNLLLVDIPFKSLQNLKAMVQTEKYRSARLVYDGEGNITGLE